MKIRKEDAPVNNAGGGEVAGLGVGADGEPGVDLRQPLGDLRKRRKRRKQIATQFPSDARAGTEKAAQVP